MTQPGDAADPVVPVPRCISATGLHDMLPPVVVRAGGFPFAPKREQAVTFCRFCGESSMAGWT